MKKDLKKKNSESGENSNVKDELKKKEEALQKLQEENSNFKSQIDNIRDESINVK